jgi:hypothetical protein
VRRAKPAELDHEEETGELGARALRLVRRCLGCLSLFDSEWAGERICRRCKHSARWRTSHDDTPA